MAKRSCDSVFWGPKVMRRLYWGLTLQSSCQGCYQLLSCKSLTMKESFFLVVLVQCERTEKGMDMGEAGWSFLSRARFFILRAHNFVGDSVSLKNMALYLHGFVTQKPIPVTMRLQNPVMGFKLGSDQVILRLIFHSKQMRQLALDSWSVTRSSSHVFQFFEEHLVILFALLGWWKFHFWHLLGVLPSTPKPVSFPALGRSMLLQIPYS